MVTEAANTDEEGKVVLPYKVSPTRAGMRPTEGRVKQFIVQVDDSAIRDIITEAMIVGPE